MVGFSATGQDEAGVFREGVPGRSGRVDVDDVTTPASSGRFKYVVVFEGLDRFRAQAERGSGTGIFYPNRENLQPYQMSGWCQTLLVQPLDEAVHRVRMKYVRVAGIGAGWGIELARSDLKGRGRIRTDE